MQTRNVINKYSTWTEELINQDLRKNAFPFAVLMEQLEHDFNIGTLIRNSNAFNSKQVFYYGPTKRYDRRGTIGTHKYVDLTYLPSLQEVLNLKKDYTFIGVDCVEGSVPMNNFKWPENTLMIFGEEGGGISKNMRELCDKIVHIEQYGSVRSLNVGTASGIAMNDYVNKFNNRNFIEKFMSKLFK